MMFWTFKFKFIFKAQSESSMKQKAGPPAKGFLRYLQWQFQEDDQAGCPPRNRLGRREGHAEAL